MKHEPEFRRRFREEDIPAMERDEEPPAMKLRPLAELLSNAGDASADGWYGGIECDHGYDACPQCDAA